MSVVVCKLPRAGLGNQLFPLMHALVFAKLNELPIIITGYHRIKIGPWIRGEKSKRTYNGFFSFEKKWMGEAIDRLRIIWFTTKYEVVLEPDIKKLSKNELNNRMFRFNKIGDYHDYFGRLKNYREQVIQILYSIINPSIIEELNEKKAPVIGIHIRMGDFRKLQKGEVYRSGHVRPPQSLFIDLISKIRKMNGKDLMVSVFSDGHPNELKEILSLKNSELVENNSDLVDLLLLSKSQLIIPTHGSTFGAWAAFLSSAPIISFFYYPKSIRSEDLTDQLFEGIFNPSDNFLLEKIKGVS